MRRRQPLGSKIGLAVVITLFALVLFLLPQTIGEEDEAHLYLVVTDTAEEPVTELYEYDCFKVSAYLFDEYDLPMYQTDVTITFNNKTYKTTEDNIEVMLVAPSVTENTLLNISASKEGCIGATASLLILNQLRLVLTPESFTVEAGNQFSVVVTDETGTPVSDVTVGIQNDKANNAVDTTNRDGRAWLTAPEDREEIVLLAQKSGYLDDTRILRVNIPQSVLQRVLQHPYTPILIAVVLLVSAVGIVYLKQRRTSSIISRSMEKENYTVRKRTPGTITSKPTSASGMTPKKPPATATNVDLQGKPKVEEIRISRPRKEKNIVPVDQTSETSIHQKKKLPKAARCEWFEGTEDFRYQIDRMTGKLDETKKDKWFEGTSDIRKKIDEALKQKDREKTKRK
jgi:hypothetical protein